MNLGKEELLTKTAYEILSGIKERGGYANDNTPDEFKDLVFINRTGYPTKNSTDYKFLSRMPGHSGIKITFDTYVHQTGKSQADEAEKIS